MTWLKKRIDGEWVEVSVMRLVPKDVALLIDRLMVLFDRPARVSERHDLNVKSEIPLEALNKIAEVMRGGAHHRQHRCREHHVCWTTNARVKRRIRHLHVGHQLPFGTGS